MVGNFNTYLLVINIDGTVGWKIWKHVGEEWYEPIWASLVAQ